MQLGSSHLLFVTFYITYTGFRKKEERERTTSRGAGTEGENMLSIGVRRSEATTLLLGSPDQTYLESRSSQIPHVKTDALGATC